MHRLRGPAYMCVCARHGRRWGASDHGRAWKIKRERQGRGAGVMGRGKRPGSEGRLSNLTCGVTRRGKEGREAGRQAGRCALQGGLAPRPPGRDQRTAVQRGEHARSCVRCCSVQGGRHACLLGGGALLGVAHLREARQQGGGQAGSRRSTDQQPRGWQQQAAGAGSWCSGRAARPARRALTSWCVAGSHTVSSISSVHSGTSATSACAVVGEEQEDGRMSQACIRAGRSRSSTGAHAALPCSPLYRSLHQQSPLTTGAVMSNLSGPQGTK